MDLNFQGWITPYTSVATVIGRICVVSLCFEIKSNISGFTNLGIVTVSARTAAYANAPVFNQADGRCIDCLIDPSDSGYIYINARGLELPANSVFRGTLVYPTK